jgi:hypothetical protein
VKTGQKFSGNILKFDTRGTNKHTMNVLPYDLMLKLLQFFGRRKIVPCFRLLFKNAIVFGWYFVIHLVRVFQ